MTALHERTIRLTQSLCVSTREVISYLHKQGSHSFRRVVITRIRVDHADSINKTRNAVKHRHLGKNHQISSEQYWLSLAVRVVSKLPEKDDEHTGLFL